MAKRDRFREYAREAAKRRVEGLQKSLDTRTWNESSRRNIEQRISQLQNAIYESRTYADGERIAGHTKASTMAAAKLLRELVSETGTQRELRKMERFEKPSNAQRNVVFSQLMNVASANQNVNVTIGKKSFTMTDTMVRMFYRAYQPLWNTGNVSVQDRNRVILEKTGFPTLEMAFAVAMGTGNNAQRAEIIDKMQAGEQMQDEEALELYNMLSEGQNMGAYQAGQIAANTETMATRNEGARASEYLNMTREEVMSALRTFLGDDFKMSDIA